MEAADFAALGMPGGPGDGESAEDVGEQGAGAEGVVPVTPASGALTTDQLARLRDVLVAANPEVVPELIGGGDLDALLASVETARAAYARVKEAAARSALAAIPRGGGTRALDPAVYADLSPEAKIAFALSAR